MTFGFAVLTQMSNEEVEAAVRKALDAAGLLGRLKSIRVFSVPVRRVDPPPVLPSRRRRERRKAAGR